MSRQGVAGKFQYSLESIQKVSKHNESNESNTFKPTEQL